MVRLNSTQLSKQQTDQLWLQLIEIISPKQPSHTTRVLHEVLGREEQIMIAKRIAAAVLITEGVTPYRIANKLKLSQTTIHSIRKKVEHGGYAHTLSSITRNKKEYVTFLDTLDTILHLGGILPHYNGLDRYSPLKRP